MEASAIKNSLRDVSEPSITWCIQCTLITIQHSVHEVSVYLSLDDESKIYTAFSNGMLLLQADASV